MGGKGKGQGQSGEKLATQIAGVKYTIFCFNIISWLIGAGLFGLTVFIRAEPGFSEWISLLHIEEYFIGVYVLIAMAVIVMIVSFLGCGSALMEDALGLGGFIGTQLLCFLMGLIGSGLLLDHSTINSSIQPLIRRSMNDLIMHSDQQNSSEVLKMIQENIGCCGADGSNDYMMLRQPLPLECRDSVTGNAFFHGCVDELTWFLEDKSSWAAGLAMVLCMIHIINAVLSVVLIQALRKEEKEARIYRQ